MSKYIDEQCFPVASLKQKIWDEMKPFNRIKAGSLHVTKNEKTRLNFIVLNQQNNEKAISVLCAEEKLKVGPRIHINSRSFENCVKHIKKECDLTNLIVSLIDETDPTEHLPVEHLPVE